MIHHQYHNRYIDIDVYKRQVSRPRNNKVVCKNAVKHNAIICFIHCVKPVSYTHLDVYKRQACTKFVFACCILNNLSLFKCINKPWIKSDRQIVSVCKLREQSEFFRCRRIFLNCPYTSCLLYTSICDIILCYATFNISTVESYCPVYKFWTAFTVIKRINPISLFYIFIRQPQGISAFFWKRSVFNFHIHHTLSAYIFIVAVIVYFCFYTLNEIFNSVYFNCLKSASIARRCESELRSRRSSLFLHRIRTYSFFLIFSYLLYLGQDVYKRQPIHAFVHKSFLWLLIFIFFIYMLNN